MTGRTNPRFWQAYINGFDVSGWSRDIGDLEIKYDEVDLTANMGDSVKGYLKGAVQANCGTLNAVFDNTVTSGIHTVLKTAGTKRLVTVALGSPGAPVDGDPCFNGEFAQGAYQVATGGAVTVSVPFDGWAADSTSLSYLCPWGTLLHALDSASAVNTSTGFDNEAGVVSTTKGGLMIYHVTLGDGDATIKVQDAAVNANLSFADLSGATTGNLTFSANQYGIIPVTGTVRRYLRWQIVLNTATYLRFVLAFCRQW